VDRETALEIIVSSRAVPDGVEAQTSRLVPVVTSEDPGDPALVQALADYLEQNPGDIERDPYWLGATLWCHELYPGKPTRDEIRQALKVISPELYARNERAVMRRREEAARDVAGSVGGTTPLRGVA
jgi:hypothetical protein